MCDVGNPGPGLMQAQQCGRVKLVNGIPTLWGRTQAPTLDNWISNGNTDIKVPGTCITVDFSVCKLYMHVRHILM
jgi:hypothetical protein